MATFFPLDTVNAGTRVARHPSGIARRRVAAGGPHTREDRPGQGPGAALQVAGLFHQAHWHERYHEDAANRWVRSMVAELFLEA